MRIAIGAVVAALCLIAAPSTPAPRGPYGSINVGNWKGGAYTNDQSGAFSHCAAGTQYESGIYFVVTINDRRHGRSDSPTKNGRCTHRGAAVPRLSLTAPLRVRRHHRHLAVRRTARSATNSSGSRQLRKPRDDDRLHRKVSGHKSGTACAGWCNVHFSWRIRASMPPLSLIVTTK